MKKILFLGFVFLLTGCVQPYNQYTVKGVKYCVPKENDIAILWLPPISLQKDEDFDKRLSFQCWQNPCEFIKGVDSGFVGDYPESWMGGHGTENILKETTPESSATHNSIKNAEIVQYTPSMKISYEGGPFFSILHQDFSAENKQDPKAAYPHDSFLKKNDKVVVFCHYVTYGASCRRAVIYNDIFLEYSVSLELGEEKTITYEDILAKDQMILEGIERWRCDRLDR